MLLFLRGSHLFNNYFVDKNQFIRSIENKFLLNFSKYIVNL